jgi:hypothetical protein
MRLPRLPLRLPALPLLLLLLARLRLLPLLRLPLRPLPLPLLLLPLLLLRLLPPLLLLRLPLRRRSNSSPAFGQEKASPRAGFFYLYLARASTIAPGGVPAHAHSTRQRSRQPKPSSWVATPIHSRSQPSAADKLACASSGRLFSSERWAATT